MALSITKTTPYNIDALHWVLVDFHIDRKQDRISIKFEGFEEAGDWLVNAKALMLWNATYALNTVPPSLLSLLGDVRDEIEVLLPTIEDFWENAIIINDDGIPIT